MLMKASAPRGVVSSTSTSSTVRVASSSVRVERQMRSNGALACVTLKAVIIACETWDNFFKGRSWEGIHRALNGGFDRLIVSV